MIIPVTGARYILFVGQRMFSSDVYSEVANTLRNTVHAGPAHPDVTYFDQGANIAAVLRDGRWVSRE